MAVNPVTAIANAFEAGAKLWNQWLVSKDKRHMQKAIEAGEKYIFTNEDDSLEEKERKRKLRYYRKRFFKFN